MQQQTRAMLFGLGAVLCWSTVATAFKLSLNYLQPAQLMLVAASTALLFFLGLLIYQGRLQRLWQQTPATYLRSLGYGAMNPLLYYLVLFSAYDRLPAQEAQVLNYSWAIVLSLLAVPMLKQAMHKADYLAAILCYAGVWVIATRGDVFALQFENGVGVLLALCSTVIWALYWIANRRDQREPVLGLCLNFLFAVP
ncbi:MAG: DMT family transporter, partial [Gammaproteobacteria bacterium]|nr:DMT family transporter [Gammaproteobacteria bacterium]